MAQSKEAIKQEIATLYKEAHNLLKIGEDEPAAKKYGQIIELNPNIPEVHFNLARLYLKHDQLQEANTHAKAATTLKPSEPDTWKFRADVVKTFSDRAIVREYTQELQKAPIDKRIKGELTTSIAFGRTSTTLLGSLPREKFLRIGNAINEGRHAEAEKLVRSELSNFPNVAALHDALGVALTALNRYDEATDAFKNAVRFDPNYALSRVNYARTLRVKKEYKESVKQSNIALRRCPGMVSAITNRAFCLEALGLDELARDDFQRALDIEPKDASATNALMTILRGEFDFTEALKVADRARSKGLRDVHVDLSRASVLTDLNRWDEAQKAVAEILKKEPDQTMALARSGEFKQVLGDFDGAREDFRRAIELEPNRGDFYRAYLASQKVPLDDPLIEAMKTHFEDASVSKESRVQFGFALGKAMEDNKAYDQVFRYLHPANAMARELEPYNRHQREEKFNIMRWTFDQVDWSTMPRNEDCDVAPIFVTGMPRSGTTLTEQIISSHSQIESGGELGAANRNVIKLMSDGSKGLRHPMDISIEELDGVSQSYKKYVETLYPGIKRWTDKSIQTYDYIGMIKLAMPKARIIVVRRDPRDNLLSIYKNVFQKKTHPYSYNLTDLAHHYQQFQKSLDFWRERVPDWFHEVHYEDLVGNPEVEARKLIDACGLEWEDACLEFYNNKNRVKTLSIYQVRQPIYKSSAKAWERYRDDLGELFEALGPEYADAAE